MITDAMLWLVGGLLDLIGAVLPDADLDLPDLSAFGGWLGEYGGPFDRWFPVSELADFLVVVVSVWLPAAIAYTVSVWIYKHMPVLGKG